MPGQGPFAVVDLGFLPGQELEAVELPGFNGTQTVAEAFDAVVPVHKTTLVDQLLVDGGGVAAQAHLLLDPLAVGFTGRGHRGVPHFCTRPRWPGWGILNGPGIRAGGRGGGFWWIH